MVGALMARAQGSKTRSRRRDRRELLRRGGRLSVSIGWSGQISKITGMISGRREVFFEIYRFRSCRIFSLITP